MNTLKKRLIALSLLTCMAFTSVVGCSSKGSSSSDNSSSSSDDQTNDKAGNANDVAIEAITNKDGNPVILPVQSGEVGSGGISAENGMNLNGIDPENVDTAPDPVVDYEPVLDENGEPVTEAVTVTSPKGEPVTEAGGQPVTEFVPVTTAVSREDAPSEYKSNSEGRYILWMDISTDENYVFNDQIIQVKFRIKDDTPNGSYPISLVTDLSTIDGISVDPDKLVNGSIIVGGKTPQAKDYSSEGFVVYGDTLGAEQGETVEFYINCKNNPGLAAILMWFYYDSNAMECLSVKSYGEFAQVDSHPSTGKSGE